ncbi:glycosyltransferase [Mycobacterium sp. M26]|uniref:glycosyltransferase n=1 Tax=Mycobacterium sp. M26 TaxID=1762962 RepID=UPI00073F48E4|nr:glycosyltransferase [Mycobacterium sp. M26]
MTRVTFLLSKDPETEHGGDLTLSRLVMSLVAESCYVDSICLSTHVATGSVPMPAGVPLVKVAKPPVRRVSMALGSARTRRSLVHVRFDSPALVSAIENSDADVFFAEHSYMAESFLRSAHSGHRGLVVNTVNSESEVWQATRGRLGRWETPRLLRDELRVARAADAVGTYDAQEAAMYRQSGVPSARWIELTLPPAPQLDLGSTGPRLAFIGTRDWPPNQEAFLESLRLWPRIADGIPGAELVIIGARKPGAVDPPYPPGVRDVGFVDDLPGLLATCRALIAPVRTGGGVRVKVLDAARAGLPIVGSSTAVGSLKDHLRLPVYDTDDEFVQACRRYLLDRAAAQSDGAALYEVNAVHWEQRRPHRALADLVTVARQARTGSPPRRPRVSR